MNSILRFTENCCEIKDVMANLSKINIVVYTREYKPVSIDPLRTKYKVITFSSAIKCPGMMLGMMLTHTQLDTSYG